MGVDDKKIKAALDATGRNALYKIHVSLGKVVNGFTDKDKAGRGRKSSAIADDKTLLPGDEDCAEEGSEEGEGVKTETVKVKEEEEVQEREEDAEEGDMTVVGGADGRRDSLVEELLSDEDVDMTDV